MLRDIKHIAVEDIAIAVIPVDLHISEEEQIWEVFILNLKQTPIQNVMIASQGYGVLNGEEVMTSTLRHFIGDMSPLSFSLIEPIQNKVFGLNNEFWLSFYINGEIFDKKYIFLPESISPSYFTNIPLIEKRGVMIR